MTFIKHLFLFIRNDCKKLQRKWLSLPLLLLFPIIIVALTAVIVISFFSPDKEEPIQVGLVDLDQSEETKLVVELIEESSQLGSFIHISNLSKKDAAEKIKDKLSAYITFPKGFTKDLYHGESVTLQITGNPNKQTEGYLIKELLDSVARHIRGAQANILTINYFAKQLPIDKETRNKLVFDQFTSFFLYTIGKDKIIDEEEVANKATSSPVHYYGLASWFVIITIWLFAFHSFLTRDDETRMKYRMRLYGVTAIQQILAKAITTLITTLLFSTFAFFALQNIVEITLYTENYLRIAFITLLYSWIFLESIAIIEVLFNGQKLRLLIQTIFTGFVLLLSGAIIPTLYFPIYIQKLLPYSFGNQAYHWLQEIVLNARFYVDYLPLTLIALSGLFVLLGISIWKERVFT
ncbi:ABC transporter permease [Virgibacillus ndiopensis]|uniref:ABC transporter permease n=1 Tax=Virgibacillus ndiopensis TaxID=2004408 RepID=UPI000C06C6B8|nr:ABC transporter permease [Virgibacillus ndiopensis]